ELGGVLHESRATSRGDVNDRCCLTHSWKGSANKRVGRLHEMIGVERTASFSKMLHSVLLSRPHEYAAISRGDLALIENGLTAADGPLDSAAEARSNVR